MTRCETLFVAFALLCSCVLAHASAARSEDVVVAPPAELVARLSLSPLYTKCVIVEGLPVVGSSKVSDYGLLEAAYLIRQEVGPRKEILRAMAANGVRFAVMAPTEMTTDVPEHSDLTPRNFWNRRARGLGATAARPAVSCGEENLLCLRGDPYATENILLHEFAHAMHEMGLNTIDPTFDARLLKTYASAKAEGLWAGTYAMENRMEYWAEGAQSWFDTNRANDNEHGPIDTREKLKGYDPRLAELLTEVFGDRAWRYVRPERRAESMPPADAQLGLAHLAGFDPATFAPFRWPENTRGTVAAEPTLAWIEPKDIPHASPRAETSATTIHFFNQNKNAVTIDWIDTDGKSKCYCTLRPGTGHLQNTFAGHVWVISCDGKQLGAVVATPVDSRAEIK